MFDFNQSILALFGPYCNSLMYKQIPMGKAKDASEMDQEKREREAQQSQYMPSDANGAEPMTGAQAAHLKRLADQLHEPAAFEQGLSSREASRRINVLLDKIRIWELPPHTD